MKYTTFYRATILSTVSFLLVIMPIAPLAALASEPPNLIITELQTGSTASASEEFIELYNSSPNPIDLADYKIEYLSASGTSWVQKVSLFGILQPYSYTVVASSAYASIMSQFPFVAGLAASGGHIRLAKQTSMGVVYQELIGWGTALKPLGGYAASAPPAGSSLQRVVQDGAYVASSQNNLDFTISSSPSPGSGTLPFLPEIEDPPLAVAHLSFSLDQSGQTNQSDQTVYSELSPVSNNDYQVDNQLVQSIPPLTDIPLITPQFVSTDLDGNSISLESNHNAVLAPEKAIQSLAKTQYELVILSEILIDPESPLLDSEDEFVEIYNPNQYTVDIGGYQLVTGLNSTYSYKFPYQTIIPAGGYFVLSSHISKLVLSNSGGQVQLKDPLMEVIDSLAYQSSLVGKSLSLDADGSWFWTPYITMGQANVAKERINDTSAVTASDMVNNYGIAGSPSANDSYLASTTAIDDSGLSVSDYAANISQINTPNYDLSKTLKISELFINPAAPRLDSQSEFIELYNPTQESIVTDGLQLEAGITTTYRYSLPSQVVPAGGYLVIYATESGIALSNQSGQARLYDKNHNLLHETVVYENAKEDVSWSFVDGIWSWTTLVTPGAPNALEVTQKQSAKPKQTTVQPTTTLKKATTPKISSIKQKTVSAPKEAAPKADKKAQPGSYEDSPETGKQPIQYVVLAVFGCITVLYAAYEYRKDVANRVYQLRRYLSLRRNNRQELKRA